MKIGEVKRYLSLLPPQHSVLILGPPGIGKSRAVREFAEEEAKRMGREFVDYDDDDALVSRITKNPEEFYVFLDLRLSETEPSDFLGVPRDIDHFIVYKPLRWVGVFSLDKIAGTLFLDEITNIRREDVLAQAYKLTLDRRAGYLRFAKNVRIIAAGNDPEHSSVANLLPAPLTNRFTVFTVEAPSVEEWAAYVNSREGGIDHRIAGYLMRFREDLLHKAESETLQNFPTPRSWSRLNEVIRIHQELDEKTVKELAAALVGPTVAAKFAAFCRLGEILPTPEKILQKPEIIDEVVATRKIDAVDAMYYAVATVTRHIIDQKIAPAQALNFIEYLLKKQADLFILMLILLPTEMRTKYMMDKVIYAHPAMRSFTADIEKYLF